MDCYRATVGDVYGYAGLLTGPDRAGAEDIVHDVYTALLARAQRGDAGVIGFGYLRRSVRNRWIDRLRAEQREQRRLVAHAPGHVHVSAVDAADAVDEMPVRPLAELPARERVVMVLRYVDQMPVDRIAEALGTTQRAVESVISRALGRLRREVRDGG